MIQKMPTYSYICKICKDIAQTIPKLEKMIASTEQQRDNCRNTDPVEKKRFQDGLQKQIDWNYAHLHGLKNAYKSILGVEYGSEQTHEIYKSSMKDYLSSTLYRRGIMKVEYEDIEPRNGEKYVRIYWTEKIE